MKIWVEFRARTANRDRDLGLFYLHTLDGTELIPGRALVAAGALVHHLLDDQVAVDHLVVRVVLDRLPVKGPLVLRLRVPLGRASQLERCLADGGLPLARLLDNGGLLLQDRRLYHLVHVAKLVGRVAGVSTDSALVHLVYVESRAAIEKGQGIGVVSPSDRGRGDSRCFACQFSIGVVGPQLRGRLRVKLGPVGKEDVM